MQFDINQKIICVKRNIVWAQLPNAALNIVKLVVLPRVIFCWVWSRWRLFSGNMKKWRSSRWLQWRPFCLNSDFYPTCPLGVFFLGWGRGGGWSSSLSASRDPWRRRNTDDRIGSHNLRREFRIYVKTTWRRGAEWRGWNLTKEPKLRGKN